MNIITESVGSCDLITIQGTVMAADMNVLDALFQRYLTVGRYQLLLDLRECTYIGSAGLSLLMTTATICRHWNRGDLRLVAPHDYLRNLLQIAGLLSEERSFFQIFEDVTSGFAAFGVNPTGNPPRLP